METAEKYFRLEVVTAKPGKASNGDDGYHVTDDGVNTCFFAKELFESLYRRAADMTIRCKFRCVSKVPRGIGVRIKLDVVTGGVQEDGNLPPEIAGGSFSFTTIGGKTADRFIPGKEFFVDLYPAAP